MTIRCPNCDNTKPNLIEDEQWCTECSRIIAAATEERSSKRGSEGGSDPWGELCKALRPLGLVVADLARLDGQGVDHVALVLLGVAAAAQTRDVALLQRMARAAAAEERL